MWMLPATGDEHGYLAGQPIVNYSLPHIRYDNNTSGHAQWSPEGTRLARVPATTAKRRYGQPGFLLVAHFTALKPSKPHPVVSSQPGAWAPSPETYQGALPSRARRRSPGRGVAA